MGRHVGCGRQRGQHRRRLKVRFFQADHIGPSNAIGVAAQIDLANGGAVGVWIDHVLERYGDEVAGLQRDHDAVGQVARGIEQQPHTPMPQIARVAQVVEVDASNGEVVSIART